VHAVSLTLASVTLLPLHVVSGNDERLLLLPLLAGKPAEQDQVRTHRRTAASLFDKVLECSVNVNLKTFPKHASIQHMPERLPALAMF
jgi:hypothetical protein